MIKERMEKETPVRGCLGKSMAGLEID